MTVSSLHPGLYGAAGCSQKARRDRKPFYPLLSSSRTARKNLTSEGGKPEWPWFTCGYLNSHSPVGCWITV